MVISGAAYGAVSMQWLLPPSPRGGTLTPAALTRQRAGECPLQPLSRAGLHAGGSEAEVGRLGKGGFGGLGLVEKKSTAAGEVDTPGGGGSAPSQCLGTAAPSPGSSPPCTTKLLLHLLAAVLYAS